MARGGPRVGAGRPKKAGGKVIKAAPTESHQAPQKPAEPAKVQTPLEFMLEVMNDPEADALRRDRMAVAAAAYCHPKAGEAGKKSEKAKAAEKAATGKFAPSAPPRLAAVLPMKS